MLTRLTTIVFLIVFSFQSIMVSADSTLSILDNALTSPLLTNFVTALEEADLTQTIDTDQELTVLAPSNAAFEKLGENLFTLLEDENKLLLQDILKYHIISGKYESSQLSQLNSLTSEFGDNINIQISNGETTFNNNSRVTVQDVQASNGVIHLVDTIILSDSLQARFNRLNPTVEQSSSQNNQPNNTTPINNTNTSNSNTVFDTATSNEDVQSSTPRSGSGSIKYLYTIIGFIILTISVSISLKGYRKGFFR